MSLETEHKNDKLLRDTLQDTPEELETWSNENTEVFHKLDSDDDVVEMRTCFHTLDMNHSDRQEPILVESFLSLLHY